MRETLAEVLVRARVRQLHVAETEKYAHVTYFFNGGREAGVGRGDRILVPSPRDVASYDQKPEMSAREVTDEIRRGARRRRLSASPSSTWPTRTWSATQDRFPPR